MEFGLHWPSASDSLLTLLGECHREENPREATRWVRLAGQGVWPAGHPLGPLVSGLCTLPFCVRYTPGVTLILVEFQISLYFFEMLQFDTYVPEIK
jgi:hypothetical protein